MLDKVPSPYSRAPLSRDITTHLGAGCVRVALYVSRYSRMSHTLQGLHTRACSPSMDVCIAGMDMSPCVLVLMIMPHQTPLYVNTCKQATAPAPTVRRASTRQRREVPPVTIVHQVFLRLCSLHLAHDARVLITTPYTHVAFDYTCIRLCVSVCASPSCYLYLHSLSSVM